MSERKTTRAEELVKELEKEILEGKLEPGTRLDEQFLARRFNVSRTPVREALRHLTSSGLVELRQHHGAIVKSFTIPELIEIFQVMAELEGLCARLSARRMIEQERRLLKKAHRNCVKRAEKRDHEGFFKANNEFHELIYSGSRNGFLKVQTHSLRNRVNPYRHYITYQPGRMENSVVQHDVVLQAILSRDGEEAHRLMREHVGILGEAAADVIASLSNPALAGQPATTEALLKIA